MSDTDDLREMLGRTIAALGDLVDGRAASYLALWSHADDVTVMGGFGSYLRGWDGVRRNTEFAASRFRSGRITGIEELAVGTSGDLGYAAWVERAEVLLAGADGPAPIAVRVTHVFRREAGEWRIVHRHGDPITEIRDAGSIVSR